MRFRGTEDTMHQTFAALTIAVSDVTGTPTPVVDPALVTPGPSGFVAIAFVAVAAMLLVWDMMRRIRRARIRSEVDEMLDAEEEAARHGESPIAPAGDDGAAPER